MKRTSHLARLRLGVLAILRFVVFATAACSPSAETSDAIRVSKALGQHGFAVNGLESRPNPNLLANVTVYSGQSLSAAVRTTASFVWGAMPVRITTLDVEAHGGSAQVAQHFSRTELEQTFGARPAGLDRDVTSVATSVAKDALKVGALALAGLAIALAGLAIAAAWIFIVVRRRRRISAHPRISSSRGLPHHT